MGGPGGRKNTQKMLIFCFRRIEKTRANPEVFSIQAKPLFRGNRKMRFPPALRKAEVGFGSPRMTSREPLSFFTRKRADLSLFPLLVPHKGTVFFSWKYRAPTSGLRRSNSRVASLDVDFQPPQTHPGARKAPPGSRDWKEDEGVVLARARN